jgi:hypothetical protein
MRVPSISTIVVAIFPLIATPAFAADQDPDAGSQSVRQACASDYMKFCAGQDAHSDSGRTCMRTHRSEFTQTCQNAMAARRAEMMERIKTACAADIAKFCNTGSQTDEGPGRCLRDHRDQLSDGCKSAFPNHRS